MTRLAAARWGAVRDICLSAVVRPFRRVESAGVQAARMFDQTWEWKGDAEEEKAIRCLPCSP